MVKQVSEKPDITIYRSSFQSNVDNPSILINNPDINIPSSIGTTISQGASSLGIEAITLGGVRGMSRRMGTMNPISRFANLRGGGAGSAVGGVALSNDF